jgi:hypothetical protein
VEGLLSGAALPPGSPTLALRNWLVTSGRASAGRSRKHRVYAEVCLYMLVRAWNAWRTGEPLHGMQKYGATMTSAKFPKVR